MQCNENEIKTDRDHYCKQAQNDPVTGLHRSDPDLAFRIRMSDPAHDRRQGDRRGHAEIGDHLAPVAILNAHDRIQQPEYDGHHLTDHISFCDKNQSADADQRGDQRQVIRIAHDEKADCDPAYGQDPQQLFIPI